MDASGEVLLVPTGSANLASVRAAFARLGIATREDATAQRIETSAAVVLPGVGAFGAAMAELQSNGVVDALRARIGCGRPTLAICLGLQLLCRSSEESPGVNGLNVVDAAACRFDGGLRVPHMGWNTVDAQPECAMLRSGDAYFANSYRLVDPPAGWSVATCEYGGAFVCAMERGDVLACQFHPELSGAWGLSLLRRWLTRAGVMPC